MAAIYVNQLQPWEENQSPSPTEERTDPFTALTRARSGGSHQTPPSPTSPTNTLHRQLSGDPEHPPAPWQRRSSFTSQNGNGRQPSRSPSKSMSTASVSPTAPATGQMPNQPVAPNMNGAAGPVHGRTSRSPSDASSASGISGSARPQLPPQTRRHPHLTMTTSTPGLMGNDLYAHDSPHGSSSSLNDHVLLPPNPAFAGKGRGNRSASARSSMHTLSSMTSEDLWNAEPDMSNPTRSSAERPLDTVRKDRRNSQLSQRGSVRSALATPAYQMDMMWPIAPPEDMDIGIAGKRSKSTANVQSLSRRSSRLTLSRKKRQSTADVPAMAGSKANSVLNSSANSSLTDIPGAKVHRNPSYASLNNRPPSSFLYSSRDFLTQMAPLDGGYAIAATINQNTTPTQSPGGSPVDSQRKLEPHGHRGSRPPVSRSAGMGRWSLDGGEHYGSRSYGNVSSAASTTSNLAAPPINSGEPSPESEDVSSISMHSLPDGASPPAGLNGSTGMSPAITGLEASPPLAVVSSIPVNPSPLSQSVTKDMPKSNTQSTITPDHERDQPENIAAPQAVPAAASRPTLPAGAATPTAASASTSTPASLSTPVAASAPPASAPGDLKNQKSAKALAKDSKAAEKADKAEAARKAKEAEEKRRQEREKAQKAKAEAKAREKEEKKKAKKEKGGLGGLFGLGGGKKAHDKQEKTAQVSQKAPTQVPAAVQQHRPTQSQQQPQKSAAPVDTASIPRPAPARQPSGQRPAPVAPRQPNSSGEQKAAPPAPAPTARQGAKPFPDRPASQFVAPSVPPVDSRQRGTGSLPNDRLAPKPVGAAEAHKEEKKKLGFFGTIRRRFSSNPSSATVKSVQAAEQKPPVPTVPARLQNGTRSQVQEAQVSPPPPAAAMRAAPPTTPPKPTAAIANPIPQIAVASNKTPEAAVVAQADLPPRSTSVRGSPAQVAPVKLDVGPSPLLPSTPSPGSASRDHASGDGSGISPSPSPLSRTRGSIKGPRPMPAARPASVASASHSASSPKAEHVQSSSFPFHKPSADHNALIYSATTATGDQAGTESSGLSQVPSHFTSSDGTEGYSYELGTPMTSEEDVRAVSIKGSTEGEADAVSPRQSGEGQRKAFDARAGSGDTVRAIVA